MPGPCRLILAALVAAAALLAPAAGSAHPEDEFCVPGETGLDPELCAALAELNSGTPAAA
jgi:hypothetical protein